MTIAALLDRKEAGIVEVACGTPVRDAVALLSTNRIGALPVMKEGRVVGVLSERDIIYCLEQKGASVLDILVEDAMTAPPITIERGAPILAALATMSARRIRHLPVTEGDRMVGFVSIGDLVAYRIARIEEEAEAMRAYIQSA